MGEDALDHWLYEVMSVASLIPLILMLISVGAFMAGVIRSSPGLMLWWARNVRRMDIVKVDVSVLYFAFRGCHLIEPTLRTRGVMPSGVFITMPVRRSLGQEFAHSGKRTAMYPKITPETLEALCRANPELWRPVRMRLHRRLAEDRAINLCLAAASPKSAL